MAVFTRVKTWVSNEVLTASDLNGEFNNLLNNTIPASIEDYSADVSTMQSTTDPGGVGTESLATTLAGEITRLRYKIKQIMNGAQWYSTPVGSLSTGGISTAALATNAVTTVKITDANVTRAKLEALGQQLSSSSSSFSHTAVSEADVTNLSVSLTTSGRPVYIAVVSDGSANSMTLSLGRSTTGTASGYLRIYRGATAIAYDYIIISAGGATATTQTIGIPFHIDVPSAGTYTYKISVENLNANQTFNFQYAKLIAYEL